MRRAFGFLEALIGLIVFSLVILVCSQTLLHVHKDLKVYDENHQTELLNTALYLKRVFQYAFINQIDSKEVDFFQINRSIFLSPDFDPINKKCNTQKIFKQEDIRFVATFSPFEIIAVVGGDERFLFLERELKCGITIPIEGRHKITWRDQKLLLDQHLLLEGIREFVMRDQGKFYEIKICKSTCIYQEIPKSEIVYEF